MLGTRRSPLLFAGALALAALIAPTPPARAQQGQLSENEEKARVSFEAGRDAYDHGRFTEALALFEHAYSLSPRSKLLFNIGRAAEAEGKNERAVEAYNDYLKANPQAENREFVEGRLRRLRTQTAAPAPATSPVATPPPPPPPPAPAATAVTTLPPLSSLPPPQVQGATYSQQAAEQAAPPAKKRRAFRLYSGLRLGTGGEATLHVDNFEGTVENDLDTTVGLQFGLGWVWRIFGITAETKVNWLKFSNTSLDRQKLVEIVVKPRFGYQFQRIPFEIYGAIPIGAAIPLFDDEFGNNEGGPSLGFLLGAAYFFTDHVGVNLEGGVQMAFLSVNSDLFTLIEGTALAANAVFAF